MTTVDHIITAKDYCERDGVPDVLARIMKIRNEFQRKRHNPMKINFDKTAMRTVSARVEMGQWIADCECGGCEFVTPDEPIFFCFSCANRDDANMLREVVFPPEREEIERALLERPVDDKRGLDHMERAGMAKAMIFVEVGGKQLPLTRSWDVGETLEILHAQQDKAIEAWRESKDGK